MESFNDRAQEMVTEESEFQIWKYYQSQGFFSGILETEHRKSWCSG